MTANKTGEETRQHRPWWKKKRWWVAGLLICCLVNLTVPYSFGGASLSCLEVRGYRDRIHRIEKIIKKHKGNKNYVFEIILRSGYSYPNKRVFDKGFLYTFLYRYEDVYLYPIRCFPVNLLSVDGAKLQIITTVNDGLEKIKEVVANG